MFYLAHARFESQNKNDPVLSYSLIYELFYSLSVRLLTYLQQAFFSYSETKKVAEERAIIASVTFFNFQKVVKINKQYESPCKLDPK